eukprot:TRINITY_DN23901_c0_g1_i1.p2 TRINITY_DN23901_c0_g1~~TRINITY_DN23901_c0_g1_i1.p2  ORF type:complete len:372 (+),score=109.34 TRINITY_DN23901_c0_g1_i1:64-1179(+)
MAALREARPLLNQNLVAMVERQGVELADLRAKVDLLRRAVLPGDQVHVHCMPEMPEAQAAAADRATAELRAVMTANRESAAAPVVAPAAGVAAGPPPAGTAEQAALRYFFKGQAPGRGKVLLVGAGPCLAAVEIRAQLLLAGVDLSRFAVFWYSEQWLGFMPLPDGEDATVPVPESRRVDIQLEELPGLTERAMRSLRLDLPEGFFGIGIVRGKTESNHGLLWRSAYQLGASFTFSVGARYKQRGDGISDTYRCAVSVPQWEFSDVEELSNVSPYGAQLVGVETGGVPLDAFEHPGRCVYLLGSEDNGLPTDLLQRCHAIVSIPCVRGASYNVAMAGSIVMYDRLTKERRAQMARPVENTAKRGKTPGDCA